MEKVIKYRFSDTGHWLARCNHLTGIIELNRREFPRLSPMMQDYVWCHEYAHLLYDCYDEDRTNKLADAIFISRAKDGEDRLKRKEFIANSAGLAHSGIAVTAIVGLAASAISLGVKVYNYYNQAKESGYYALNSQERYELLQGLIKASFEAAKAGGKSAKQIFWQYMVKVPGVEPDYTSFISNQANHLARSYIAKCEAQYGFRFDQELPVDWLAKPAVKYALIGLAVVAVALFLVKKMKKH